MNLAVVLTGISNYAHSPVIDRPYPYIDRAHMYEYLGPTADVNDIIANSKVGSSHRTKRIAILLVPTSRCDSLNIPISVSVDEVSRDKIGFVK
jgi:hypothetical protein